MNKKSSSITIYFGLSKGEGNWPEASTLSRKESYDPRTFCTFQLDLDEEAAPNIDLATIKSCTVIYDGICPLSLDRNQSLGLALDKKGKLTGRVRPIIRFELSTPVDPEKFRRLVWGSSYEIKPAKAEEGFYCEDWNGYTEVLDAKQEKQWIARLQKAGLYSGQVFTARQMAKGVTASKMEVNIPDIKERNTAAYQDKIKKARLIISKNPRKFARAAKAEKPVLILHEKTSRGAWQVSLTNSKLLCPQPFLVAIFFPKNKPLPSGFSVSVLDR